MLKSVVRIGILWCVAVFILFYLFIYAHTLSPACYLLWTECRDPNSMWMLTSFHTQRTYHVLVI
jgi:hypothetical protein